MPVQAFSFPIPETRFFQVGQHVYKFKIKPGSKISSEEEMLDSEFVSEELENAVRVVLMSLDNLHPFATQHFNIFPYKSKWERVSELRFRKGDTKLFAYPFLVTLYVETNEPIHPLRANHASTQVPSDRESRLDSPRLHTSCAVPLANEPKRRRTEEPQEGPLSSEELPEGAEEIVCGNEIHTDSEEISPAPSGPSPEFDVVEQDAPDCKCTEREKPGALARLVSVPMARRMTPDGLVLMLPLVLLVLLTPFSWSSDGLGPGCHLYPINLTIRSDRKGTCQGAHVVYACVGYCDSSAFPSRYSVLLASNFTHNITSVSRCCTISKSIKVKVHVECPEDHHHDNFEVLTAQACRCHMCHKTRY